MKDLLFFILYVIAFLGTLLGVAWWDRRKRRTRRPLPEDIKLLRMPGEHLWRRVTAGDESDVQWFLIAILIPIFVGFGALLGVMHLPASWATSGLVGVVVLFVFALLLCVRWFHQRLQRRANDYLGFFGERYVAEILDPLKATGWFIFHDVQCQGATGKFNLDHVAVGPGGVWVIETKTRRKGRARPGFKDYQVVFDGNRLIWAWGEDTRALQQAGNNMTWLNEWLKKMTGTDFSVRGVLTFPGYEVIERKLTPLRVVYTKGLRDAVTSLGNEVLGPSEIDLIRRQLEEKCRDVEY
jgi:hypothetical protein